MPSCAYPCAFLRGLHATRHNTELIMHIHCLETSRHKFNLLFLERNSPDKRGTAVYQYVNISRYSDVIILNCLFGH